MIAGLHVDQIEARVSGDHRVKYRRKKVLRVSHGLLCRDGKGISSVRMVLVMLFGGKVFVRLGSGQIEQHIEMEHSCNQTGRTILLNAS